MIFDEPENDQELLEQKWEEPDEAKGRPEQKNKDYFAEAGKIEPEILIPPDASHLLVDGMRLEIPDCLKGGLLIKAVFYHLNHCGLSPQSAKRYKYNYRNVFRELDNEKKCDEVYALDQVSNAIKRIEGINDYQAKNHQKKFVTALRQVAGNRAFSIAEQITAQKTLATFIPFQDIRNHKKRESIANTHKDQPYSDADYISSIRVFAFLHHSIWKKIRKQFLENMAEQHARLIDILTNNKELAEECTTSILGNSTQTNPHLKDNRDEIRQIMLEAVSGIDDPCYTEAIFLSIVYSQTSLSDAFLEQTTDRIVFKEGVNHERMKEVVKGFINANPCKNGRFSAYEIVTDVSYIKESLRRVATGPTLFSPFHLIMPYAPDEMGIYAALLLSDRISPSSLEKIQVNDIKFLDSSLMESKAEIGSRATLTGTVKIYKGRNGTRSEIPTYSRKDTYYDILSTLHTSRKEAIGRNLLGHEDTYIFRKIIRGDKTFSGFTGSSLGHGKIAQTTLCPIVVKGTRYYELCNQYQITPFHELMISASQRITNQDGRRKNPILEKWPGLRSKFLNPTAISASREEADNAAGLRDIEVSDDMQTPEANSFYENLDLMSEQQFHSIKTRLNTYYNRSSSKAVIACREKFAAQVGDEMVQIAEVMCGRLGEDTEIITAERAMELCGFNTPKEIVSAEDIIIQADAQGSLLNDIGFMSAGDGDRTLIVKSDFHALLIIAKIEHIDKGVDSLLISNERLVPRAIARRMFLTAIIDQFESSMVERAKSRWETLKRRPKNNPIAFAALEVTLGDLE